MLLKLGPILWTTRFLTFGFYEAGREKLLLTVDRSMIYFRLERENKMCQLHCKLERCLVGFQGYLAII